MSGLYLLGCVASGFDFTDWLDFRVLRLCLVWWILQLRIHFWDMLVFSTFSFGLCAACLGYLGYCEFWYRLPGYVCWFWVWLLIVGF